jgi:hypothetical protein
MRISIKIADKAVIARVADNATARDFVSLLPLDLSMKDLFGREKVRRFAQAAFREKPQGEYIRSRRDRLLVSGPPGRHLLPPGWRVDTFTRHHPARQDRCGCRSVQRAGIGEGDH